MTQFITMTSVLSIAVYSISLGLCLMLYGKTGKKVLQYAGTLMFVYIFYSVYAATQSISGFSAYSPLALSAMLAFNIAEIYFLGRIVYSIFQKSISVYFYIWLCVIIIINGLISLFPATLSLWNFISFNTSVIVICTIYWDSLMRLTSTEHYEPASRYNSIILIMIICAASILAYCITNLSLFQKVPSQNLLDLYRTLFGLIVSAWFIRFCQKEYEEHTSLPIKHAFRSQSEATGPADEPPAISDPADPWESARTQYELTDRETEILQLILSGKSNQEISDALFITVGTVKAHVHSIFGKLEVTSRGQLIARFMDPVTPNLP